MNTYTDEELMARAAAFARRAHEGQTRRGSDTPYFAHVAAVAAEVERHRALGLADAAQVAAAYLHDTAEDCGVTEAELRDLFGEDVAALVIALTNDREAKHRMGKVPYMVAKLQHLTPRALLVKLCDTLCNISDTPTDRQRAEYVEIQRLLRCSVPAGWTEAHAALSDRILRAGQGA